MSDDGDEDLQAFLRQHFGLNGAKKSDELSSNTHVLDDAQYIYDNSVDVALDMLGTRAAAESIYQQMQQREYSPKTWSSHELHPNYSEGLPVGTAIPENIGIASSDIATTSTPHETPLVEDEANQVSKDVAALSRTEGAATEEQPTPEAMSPDSTVLKQGEPNSTAESPSTDVSLSAIGEAPSMTMNPTPRTLRTITDPTEQVVNFIFTLDLLNFSFWSANSTSTKTPGGYTVLYKSRTYSGYWALVAAIRRALDAGIPLTNPEFWADHGACTDDLLRVMFRSTSDDPKQQLSLLDERIQILRDAAAVLTAKYDMSVLKLIESANGSAGRLVNTLAQNFPSCFLDASTFEGRKVRFLKRAQIFVADLWACFEGTGPGAFSDIHHITMFADYRIPQILHTMGCLYFSPSLEQKIRKQQVIEHGSAQEIEIRGCSIWSVEMIRRQIVRDHPETESRINAVLLDFFLYDRMKEIEREIEAEGEGANADGKVLPHHRTRSIWY